MTKVIFLVLDMSSVDPDDASLPEGVTPEKVKAGIDNSMSEMEKQGWSGELFAIKPTDDVTSVVKEKFSGAGYDCVVVGGAIRLPEDNLELFEQVLNAIREAAPDCAIAFNASLTDMHEAAGRWVNS